MLGTGLVRGCPAAADLQQQHQCWGPTVHWQKQQQLDNSSVVPATSPRADRAYKLYSECVRDGQWARVTVEQHWDGEYITLLCRPIAAVVVTAAAASASRISVRKRNLRRKEKISERRRNHKSKQGMAQLTSSCNNSSCSSHCSSSDNSCSSSSDSSNCICSSRDSSSSPSSYFHSNSRLPQPRRM